MKVYLSCFMNYEEYDMVVLTTTLFSCPEITFLCNLQYKPLVLCDFQNIFLRFTWIFSDAMFITNPVRKLKRPANELKSMLKDGNSEMDV